MDELGIINLYEESSKNKNKEFIENVNSNLRVITNYDKTSCSFEWLDIMEDTIKYLDNILRNPNRFIVNEEEIVKIEQTRKVSVETIKHLSKNTNFIQKIDEKTGDVIPSRLLNVRKEESFNTYENRLIYTLMQNIKFFIHKRKELIEQSFDKNNDEQGKNNKQLEYNAKSKLNEEDVDINVSISSKLNSQENEKNDGNGIVNRIEEIEKKIKDVESSEVYKILDKLHVILVKDPVRKTNVVLKNVHFQYAMKLWEYLKVNMDEQANSSEENRDFLDNGTLKKMMDEAFLLQYLIMKTLDEDEKEKQDTKQEIKALVVEQMLDKIMDCDEDITEEQLQQLVAEKYEVIKYKKMAVLQDIQKIFKKHIEKYEEIVE